MSLISFVMLWNEIIYQNHLCKRRISLSKSRKTPYSVPWLSSFLLSKVLFQAKKTGFFYPVDWLFLKNSQLSCGLHVATGFAWMDSLKTCHTVRSQELEHTPMLPTAPSHLPQLQSRVAKPVGCISAAPSLRWVMGTFGTNYWKKASFQPYFSICSTQHSYDLKPLHQIVE